MIEGSVVYIMEDFEHTKTSVKSVVPLDGNDREFLGIFRMKPGYLVSEQGVLSKSRRIFCLLPPHLTISAVKQK